MDNSEENRVVEVAGIKGNDDDALVVGRVTFSPEVAQALADAQHNGDDGLMSAEELRKRHDAGWTLTPKGRVKAGLDKHVPLPPVSEDTAHQPKTGETLGDGIDGGGKRMNAGKLRMELIPPEWFVALADVMTQGSKKYAPRNWEQGMKWSTMIGSMKRHIAKFEAGERYDGLKFDIEAGTTGCHHLAMIAWNALALMSYDLRSIGTNDLPDDDGLALLKRVNAETSDKGNSIYDE